MKKSSVSLILFILGSLVIQFEFAFAAKPRMAFSHLREPIRSEFSDEFSYLKAWKDWEILSKKQNAQAQTPSSRGLLAEGVEAGKPQEFDTVDLEQLALGGQSLQKQPRGVQFMPGWVRSDLVIVGDTEGLPPFTGSYSSVLEVLRSLGCPLEELSQLQKTQATLEALGYNLQSIDPEAFSQMQRCEDVLKGQGLDLTLLDQGTLMMIQLMDPFLREEQEFKDLYRVVASPVNPAPPQRSCSVRLRKRSEAPAAAAACDGDETETDDELYSRTLSKK